jgi:hypothetical protein
MDREDKKKILQSKSLSRSKMSAKSSIEHLIHNLDSIKEDFDNFDELNSNDIYRLQQKINTHLSACGEAQRTIGILYAKMEVL